MAFYSVGLIAYVVATPNLSFAEWHGLFSQGWMKVATLLVILCLLFHAWVGMWTVYTDYVKPFVIRCLLNTITFFALAACFFWGLMILWSV
jgi:succinate dehydrogenase / fumarate reductase membrane anchor subunit